MEKGIDLIDRELSFEQFEHLASNIPKRSGRSVLSLVEIDIIDDLDETLSVYPEFRISRCCKGLFSSMSKAKAALQSCVRNNESAIYCFRPRSPIFVNAGAVKRRADVFAQ